jgi:acyl-CoA synthetase (AMP-forming)/AMP-acid ligase II
MNSEKTERILNEPELAVQGYTNLVTLTFSGDYDEQRPVLIDGDNPSRFLSRKKAAELVVSLAGNFTPGSTVCLNLTNDILYPILILAILASGCRWTGTNPAYKAPELEHHFRMSGMKYIITDLERLATVEEALNSASVEAEIILFTDLLSELMHVDSPMAPTNEVFCGKSTLSKPHRTLRDLTTQVQPTDLTTLTRNISPQSTAALMSTSGTSGLPKIASLTHHAIMRELLAIEDNNAAKPYEVRRLFCVPIFHAFANPEMAFNALRLGQTCYFMKRFDINTFPVYVQKYGITETFGPPAMLLRLVNTTNSHHMLQSLRMVAFGGAPLGAELRRKFLDTFQVKPRIVPVYGMTEGGWYTTLKYPEQDETGSLGRPIPGYEIKIVPKPAMELDSVSQKEVGEILVRGPQLMTAYLGDPEATAESFDGDGWLKTGDIGYLDESKVYLVDRAKDLIKVNGWHVSPGEIENALLQHPEIIDAAAFGVGRDVEEHPVACVVLRVENGEENKMSLSEQKVRQHLMTSLADYKVRSCEVRFVKEIPKNPAGKILRARLREEVLKGEAEKRA